MGISLIKYGDRLSSLKARTLKHYDCIHDMQNMFTQL